MALGMGWRSGMEVGMLLGMWYEGGDGDGNGDGDGDGDRDGDGDGDREGDGDGDGYIHTMTIFGNWNGCA